MRLTLIAAGLALAACAPPTEAPGPGICAALGALKGRNVGEIDLARVAHAVIPPGASRPAARAGLLVLRVDDKGWITEARCD